MFAQYEGVQNLGKQGMDFALRNFETMQKGFQAIASEVAEFSKRQLETSSAAFEKLASAKSFEKAVEVQAEFAKETFDSFVAHSSRVGQLVSNFTKDAVKPAETAVAQATRDFTNQVVKPAETAISEARSEAMKSVETVVAQTHKRGSR